MPRANINPQVSTSPDSFSYFNWYNGNKCAHIISTNIIMFSPENQSDSMATVMAYDNTTTNRIPKNIVFSFNTVNAIIQ